MMAQMYDRLLRLYGFLDERGMPELTSDPACAAVFRAWAADPSASSDLAVPLASVLHLQTVRVYEIKDMLERHIEFTGMPLTITGPPSKDESPV